MPITTPYFGLLNYLTLGQIVEIIASCVVAIGAEIFARRTVHDFNPGVWVVFPRDIVAVCTGFYVLDGVLLEAR